MKTLSRAGLAVAVVGWLVLAAFGFGYYGGDIASAILGGLGLLIGVAAAYCLGRAIDERGQRVGLLWAGRAFALFGAAFAILFPAVLYGEIVQLVQRRKALTYDIEAAIWQQFRVLPLTVVPALLALRWGRIGGLLFLLLAVYNVADGLYHFGGVNYFPDGVSSLPELLLVNAPVVLTAALLYLGSAGWRDEEGGTFPRAARRAFG